jgi:prolyl oligopeptidase
MRNLIRGAARMATLAAIAAGFMLMTQHSAAIAKKYKYPEAAKGDVVEDYHGTKVADPYRWLEDPDSKETQAWVGQENELTRSYIDSYGAREGIEDRLKTLFNYERYSLPTRYGDRYYYSKNDGLQNQSVLYMQSASGGDPVVVLDPNKLSADGTVALTGTSYTEDGALLAYGLSASGSDWQEVHIRDVDAAKDFEEVLKWCKFSSVAWKHDKSGFWYNRFPGEGETGHEEQGTRSRVCWHKLGTPQSADVIVHQDEKNIELGFSPVASHDGKYVGALRLARHRSQERHLLQDAGRQRAVRPPDRERPRDVQPDRQHRVDHLPAHRSGGAERPHYRHRSQQRGPRELEGSHSPEG